MIRKVPFQYLQWLFPIAVTLHNCEEAIYMPGWLVAHSERIPLHPGTARIRFALLFLALAAFVVTYLSAKRGKESVWAYIQFGSVAATLANVVVPHVPATLFFREYTPGVVTATLVNLPVMILLFARAIKERWVSGTKAAMYAVLLPLALAAAILALFKLP